MFHLVKADKKSNACVGMLMVQLLASGTTELLYALEPPEGDCSRLRWLQVVMLNTAGAC